MARGPWSTEQTKLVRPMERTTRLKLIPRYGTCIIQVLFMFGNREIKQKAKVRK